MKNAKMLTILILALILCFVWVSSAAPVGTAFTYQGRLTEDDNPAEGIYDFQFSLYDDPNSEIGNQIGTTIDINDQVVIDGYFTVELDFGHYVFDGNARWLEITVVQNEGAAPDDFITLTPRQELTPTPYAIYAENAGPDNDWMVSDVDMYSIPSGKVGIGTDQPGYRLEVKSSGYMDGMAVTSSDGQRLFRVRQNSDTSCGIHVFGDNDNVGAAVSGKGTSYFNGGNVGIGTTNPLWKLEVANYAPGDSAESAVTADDAGGAIAAYSSTFSTFPHLADRVSLFSNSITATGLDLRADGGASDIRFYTGGITPSKERMRITPSGNVGIGTTNPSGVLYTSSKNLEIQGTAPSIVLDDTDGTAQNDFEIVNGGDRVAFRDATAGVEIMTLQLTGTHNTIVRVLEITGGSDLSEHFDVRSQEESIQPSPGMVVSIDPENPGELLVSTNAYDRKVAGIISGAGGVKPGMLMGQKGSMADGDNPVALTGRVYCWAVASNGAIQPGDLLTTSNTPGHAMKVTDHNKAQGAIIGKAMSSLEEDKGMVLVLVSLQ